MKNIIQLLSVNVASFGDGPRRFGKRKTECPASNLTLDESLVERRTSGQSAELVELEREPGPGPELGPVLEQEPSSVVSAVGAGAASAAAGADGAFAAERATWV